MIQQILLPHKSKTITLNLAWEAAVAETLYPLHQQRFAKTPQTPAPDYATARRTQPDKIQQETTSRLLEYLHQRFPASLPPLLAKASSTPTLTVSVVKITPQQSIDHMMVHIAHRPKGCQKDHRTAFILSAAR